MRGRFYFDGPRAGTQNRTHQTRGGSLQYIAFLTFYDSLTPEQRQGALGRRATYQFPANLKPIGEYWSAGQPEVVLVFEADTFDPIFKLQLDWQDMFRIQVHPMITSEAGLQMGARLMGAG